MTIIETLEEWNPDALLIDGHDSALIGIGGAYNQRLAVYSEEKIIKNLMDWGMEEMEAVEFCEINIKDSYNGPNTPIIVTTTFLS